MKNKVLPLLAFCSLPLAVLARDANAVKSRPYGFIENKGQITDQNLQPNAGVKYLLNSPGLNVQLRAGGFSYDTYTTETKGGTQKPTSPDYLLNHKQDISMKYNFHRVDISLEGSNPQSRIVAEDAGADVINYYTTGKEVTGIHHYSKITYQNIYTGIDLQFTSAPNSGKPVEYDFIVHPGADASQIKLHYTGAGRTELSNGKINITVAQGELQESIPASFVSETHDAVAVKYIQTGNSFSYNVPAYNHAQTLIIDPTPDLGWGTYYGGSDNDYGEAVAVSGSDLYLGGATFSTSNIATSGAFQTSVSSGVDCFVAKFNASTGVRIWGTYYGGVGNEVMLGMAADASNVYFSGQTNSTSGITTSGAHQASFGGTYDAFLVKLNNSGVRQWGTYYGGADNEYSGSIALDGSGNIYMTGTAQSTSGIATLSSAQSFNAGYVDAFLVKFNSSGVRQWGTYAGASALDEGYGVATDASGNVFISGIVYGGSASYLTTSGAYQTTYGGDTTDYFIEKYNTNGVRQWGTYYGGAKGEFREAGQKLAADASGNVYLVGSTMSTNGIATSGSFLSSTSGFNQVGFLVKFNGSGARQWGTYYYGDADNTLTSVAADAAGNTYIGGYADGSNGLESTDPYQPYNAGGLDMTIAKFNTSGAGLWSTYWGDYSNEDGNSIAADANGHVFICGTTASQSSSSLATSGTQQTSFYGGNFDAFLSRFNACNGATINLSTAVISPCFGSNNGRVIVTATGGASPYQYSLGSIGPQTSDTFKNVTAGNYTIMVQDDNECSATLTLPVTANAQVTTPTILGASSATTSQTINYLILPQSSVTYNWSVVGGTILSGQGTSQISVKWGSVGTGNVKIVVSSSSYCGDSANTNVSITPDAVTDVTGGIKVAVYPNPTTNDVHFDLLLNKAETVFISLTDVAGREVYSTGMQNFVSGKNNIVVPMTQLASGSYFYHVKNNEGNSLITGKIIKQ